MIIDHFICMTFSHALMADQLLKNQNQINIGIRRFRKWLSAGKPVPAGRFAIFKPLFLNIKTLYLCLVDTRIDDEEVENGSIIIKGICVMEFWFKLLLLAILAGLAWLIHRLANDESYQKSMHALKNLLAMILGFATTFFLPQVYLFICSYTISLASLTENTAAVVLSGLSIAGSVASVIAGIYVYYFLCNKTRRGGKLGYLLYGLDAVFCIINAYEQFFPAGNRIADLGWVAAFVAGLAVTRKLCGDFCRYIAGGNRD